MVLADVDNGIVWAWKVCISQGYLQNRCPSKYPYACLAPVCLRSCFFMKKADKKIMEVHTDLLIELMQKQLKRKTNRLENFVRWLKIYGPRLPTSLKPLKRSEGNFRLFQWKISQEKCRAKEKRRNRKSNSQNLCKFRTNGVVIPLPAA